MDQLGAADYFEDLALLLGSRLPGPARPQDIQGLKEALPRTSNQVVRYYERHDGLPSEFCGLWGAAGVRTGSCWEVEGRKLRTLFVEDARSLCLEVETGRFLAVGGTPLAIWADYCDFDEGVVSLVGFAGSPSSRYVASQPTEAAALAWRIVERTHTLTRTELHLAAGGSQRILDQVEESLSTPLPDHVRAMYALHDGWDDIVLPLETALKVWRRWCLGGQRHSRDIISVDGPIQPVYWDPKWLPLNDCADVVCLDLNPAPGGVVGQVLRVQHDDPIRTVLASSLAEYLVLHASWGGNK